MHHDPAPLELGLSYREHKERVLDAFEREDLLARSRAVWAQKPRFVALLGDSSSSTSCAVGARIQVNSCAAALL
mgnify:CR=1 FL=1